MANLWRTVTERLKKLLFDMWNIIMYVSRLKNALISILFLQHRITQLAFVFLLGIVLSGRDRNSEWIFIKEKRGFSRKSHP